MTETAFFLGIESSVKRVWNLNAQKTLTQKNQHNVNKVCEKLNLFYDEIRIML